MINLKNEKVKCSQHSHVDGQDWMKYAAEGTDQAGTVYYDYTQQKNEEKPNIAI